MTAEIIKLPYSVTRGAYSRKPRRSKNGIPEERAAKAKKASSDNLVRLRQEAIAKVTFLIDFLDATDGDPDLERCCEDEGAQCDDEGVVA